MRAAWLAGASDYLKEPWTTEELFLRLRGPRSAVVDWSWQRHALRLEGTTLSTEGPAVELTAAESEVLRMLVERRGLAVPRRILAWAAGCSDGRVVDTLVGRIRLKLRRATASAARSITAVRGVGYQFP
jgi:DNA-binding response OmpR family regulator